MMLSMVGRTAFRALAPTRAARLSTTAAAGCTLDPLARRKKTKAHNDMVAGRWIRREYGDHAAAAIRPDSVHAAPTVPHLHDLVGDESQPGLSGGYGVKAVALRPVARGEVVFREGGVVYSQASMHSVQIGPSHHCQIDGEGRFSEHSFTPNCAVVVSPLAERPIEFVALRPIEAGEPFSFDYTTTEWELQDGG